MFRPSGGVEQRSVQDILSFCTFAFTRPTQTRTMSAEDSTACTKSEAKSGVTMYPYLFFRGDCSAAMDFYVEHLGAKIDCKMTFKEGPPVAEEHKDCIMHAVLSFKGNTVMMSDVVGEGCCGGDLVVGNNVTINLNWDDIPAMTKAFEGMSAEGKVLLRLEPQFWGATYGKFVDKFDISWSFNSSHAGHEDKKEGESENQECKKQRTD